MDQFFLGVGIVLLCLMIPVLVRVIIGPTSIDRMIGVNIIGTKTTVLLVLIGSLYHRLDMFIDLAIAYALLNFIASIAAARLVRRRAFSDQWGRSELGSPVGGGE